MRENNPRAPNSIKLKSVCAKMKTGNPRTQKNICKIRVRENKIIKSAHTKKNNPVSVAVHIKLQLESVTMGDFSGNREKVSRN